MWPVILCSIDPAKRAAATAMYRRLLANEPHEIIHIGDARSLCEGYNRGVRQSTGEVLIFSHDDVEILDAEFAAKMKARLQSADLLGFAGTTLLYGPQWIDAGPPHLYGQIAHPLPGGKGFELTIWSAAMPVVMGMQALDGLLMVARRDAALAVPFDETTFDGFHFYDLDFSYRVHQAGMKVGVCTDVPIVHWSTGQHGPAWEEHARRFIRKHPHVQPGARVSSQFCIAQFETKEELLRAFQPPHWKQLP